MLGRSIVPILLILTLATTAHAQVEGVFVISDWPASAVDAGVLTEETVDDAEMLPYIDTLRVGYELTSHGDRPHVRLMIEWQLGPHGILHGERVGSDELPADVRLQTLRLHADVHDGERAVADFWLPLDGLELAAQPAVYRTEIDTFTWSELFPGLEKGSAQRMLTAGARLANPSLAGVSFDADEDFYTQLSEQPERERPARRRAPRSTVVVMDPGVWVDIWILGPPRVHDPYRPRPRHDGTPRGERGRDGSATTRRRGRGDGESPRDRDRNEDDGEATSSDSSRSGRGVLGRLFDGKSDEDDDDEDDDATLLPAALAGAAAVGILAAAGGSIGYYGNMQGAPIGLEAGYVGRRGGALAQVAVNDAVIADRDAPERMIAKITGFYDAFDQRLQPAIGVGAFAEQYAGELNVTPSLSLGAVFQHDALLFYAGYDLTAGGLDLGVAFNFRHR